MAATTSALDTTPPRPEPATVATSIPASVASRAAAGDSFTSADGAPAAGAASTTAATGATATGATAAAATAPPAVISPSSSPTFTTSPSLRRRADNTPASSAGTSTVILSVSSSTSVSPAATRSPSCLSQREIVASTMDSPRGGTLMDDMECDGRGETAKVIRSNIGREPTWQGNRFGELGSSGARAVGGGRPPIWGGGH